MGILEIKRIFPLLQILELWGQNKRTNKKKSLAEVFGSSVSLFSPAAEKRHRHPSGELLGLLNCQRSSGRALCGDGVVVHNDDDDGRFLFSVPDASSLLCRNSQ